MNHNPARNLTICFLSVCCSITLSAASYRRDAESLFIISRDMTMPVVLQSNHFTATSMDKQEIERRYRLACLYLEAAVARDATYAQAWRDMSLIYTSILFDDAGRAYNALENYQKLVAEDSIPLDSWIAYRFKSLNDRPAREDFLQETLKKLDNYPSVRSTVWTMLAELELNTGNVNGARSYFDMAFTSSNYNYLALENILNLPLPAIQADENTPAETVKALQQQQQLNHSLETILYLRIKLLVNPYSLDATLNLISALEQFGWEELTPPYLRHAWRLITLFQTQKTKETESLKKILLDKLKKLNTAAARKTTGGNSAVSAQTDSLAQARRMLLNRFDDSDLLIPLNPEKFVKCQVRLETDIFSYNDPMFCDIYITNISNHPLYLGPDSFLNPYILLTVRLQPLSRPKAPETVYATSYQYLIRKRILGAGRSNKIRETLKIGPLRDILLNHPQESYRITIQAFLDPVPDGQGGIIGKIPEIQPKALQCSRPGFPVTAGRLQTQQQFLLGGTVEPGIQSAFLFRGLLKEALLAQKQSLAYPAVKLQIKGIYDLFARALNRNEPRLQAWCLYALKGLLTQNNQDLIRQIISKLDSKDWFVRFMAAQALAPVADMSDYFKWAAENDSNEIVRRLAQLQLHQSWNTKEPPPKKQSTAGKP